MTSKTVAPFGTLPSGAEFYRNGMRWRKEGFPSGHNARYLGDDGRYFSVHFKDFQEVRPVEQKEQKK